MNMPLTKYLTPEEILKKYKFNRIISGWTEKTLRSLVNLCLIRAESKDGSILIDPQSFESFLITIEGEK